MTNAEERGHRFPFVLALVCAGVTSFACASFPPVEVQVSPQYVPRRLPPVAGPICDENLLIRVIVSSRVPVEGRLEAGTIGRQPRLHHAFTVDPLAILRDAFRAELLAAGCQERNRTSAAVVMRVVIREARVFSHGAGYGGIALGASLEGGQGDLLWKQDFVVDKVIECPKRGHGFATYHECDDENCSALATEVISDAVARIMAEMRGALVEKGILKGAVVVGR